MNKKLLNKRLSDAIRRGIFEGMKRARREIYTIDAVEEETGEAYEDMSISGTYYDEDEALDAAREFARSLVGLDELVVTYVYSGEYQTPTGDVFGEPDAFYSISNKGREETIEARSAAGYTRPECDEYATDYLSEEEKS